VINFVKQVLTAQFEAALAMLKQCVEACPPDRWEGKIANDTFRQVAYHTLFFVDLYLTPNEDAFVLRNLHRRGGDEREPTPTVGLSKEETLEYAIICRQKMIDALAVETEASLQGPSGFSYRRFSRCELHVYNIRHVQHHAGQLSACLRRIDSKLADRDALPWVSTGWG
jgi:hypothetical protein